MSALGPHVLLLSALTTAVGVAMSRIGMGTGLLRQRQARRRCPSCGRLPGPHGCKTCGP